MFDWTLPTNDGTYQLCWVEPGTARYRPGKGCVTFNLHYRVASVSIPSLSVSKTRKSGTYKLRVSYRVQVRLVFEQSDLPVSSTAPAPTTSWTQTVATLVVRRGAKIITTRHLRLDQPSKTLTFSKHVPPGTRSLTFQLRPLTQNNGSFAWTSPRTVKLPQATSR